MTEYVTKDSGERQNFNSGARRDISTGKTRPDLISVKAIRRWADLMARGAEKYGSRNWELGMPVSRFQESAERHLLNYKEGDREEDHLAAILFNIGAMIHFEGTEWDDINPSVESDNLERFEQLELPFYAEPEPDLINWDKLKQDCEAGQIDPTTVRWPHGYQAPTTES